MVTAWVLIGVVMLVVMFSVHGTDGCLLLPVAFGLWLLIGIVMWVFWAVFSETPCTPDRAGTAYCADP